MAQCNNCQAGLSCGCQKRQASDGRSCCSGCIREYETKLKLKKVQKKVHAQLFNNTGSQT